MKSTSRKTGLVLLAGMMSLVIQASSHAVPWVTYADAQSASVCEVVNSSNLELVVLEETGELVSISGTDLAFIDTLVDVDGTVYLLGQPVGYIEFATDGEGFRSLWLFSLLDDVAVVDSLTGLPLPSGLLPADFVSVPCSACDLWDEPDECIDTDVDGIVDADDLCFNTPFDEVADDFGCSCSQIDDDDDGIVACDDFCPNTPFDEIADDFGCSCSQLDDDGDGVNNCDDFCVNTPIDLLVASDGCACEELDGDGDGINACFDLCPGTPFGVVTDIDGCSCIQLDDDLDGVSNCDDLCTETPRGSVVGLDGCVLVTAPGGGINVSLCGAVNAMIFPVMFCGLAGFRHRWRARTRTDF